MCFKHMTSTLIEGLNMPAKNIFIYKLEKGQRTPINNLSFWSLAGKDHLD